MLDALGCWVEPQFRPTPYISNLDICFQAPAEAVLKGEDALPSLNQIVQGVTFDTPRRFDAWDSWAETASFSLLT